jgi:hypothetical protein
LAACEDGPTAPTSYVQEAEGRTWVMEPDGLPSAATWLPYVDRGSPALARIHDLRAAAGKLRRAGRLELAAAMEAKAGRVAAASLARSPAPDALARSFAALERWSASAGERLESGSYPELRDAVEAVHRMADSARAGLARGDTATAAVQLTLAADRVREQAPSAVALRLVAAAEARLATVRDPGENLLRAKRLLRGAREGMVTGDYRRALRRAVYALQIVDAELPAPDTKSAGGG